jgi:hypothetical protein
MRHYHLRCVILQIEILAAATLVLPFILYLKQDFCMTSNHNMVQALRSNRPSRLVILALVCISAVLNLRSFQHRVKHDFVHGDAATVERSLRELRRALPSQGRVGYIADENPFAPDASWDAIKLYYLTQFALAPLIVEPGTAPSLVVGYFVNFNPTRVPENLVLIQRFEPGVMLFQKRRE